VLWQGGEIGPANPAGLGIVWLIGSPRVGRVDTIHTTTHRAGVGGGMGREDGYQFHQLHRQLNTDWHPWQSVHRPCRVAHSAVTGDCRGSQSWQKLRLCRPGHHHDPDQISIEIAWLGSIATQHELHHHGDW
jgi:hypothetical protein